MIKGLRRKFVLVNMSIVTVMLTVIFGMILGTTGRILKEQSIDAMHFLLEEHDFSAGVSRQRGRLAQLPFFYVSVDRNDTVISIQGGYYDVSDSETLLKIVSLVQQGDLEMGFLKDYNLRFCRKHTPYGAAIAFVDVTHEQVVMRNLWKNCILIGLLAASVFLAISFRLARWAIHPVELAWNQQRQFVADASHELKTPLTVIMANADFLASNEYDEQQKGQFVSSILVMSRQMRGLVESLLELARVDNGTAKVVFTETELSSLVSDAVLPFEPVYFEKDLQLEYSIAEDIRVNGSAARLKQVVDILLDNAAKYSTPRGCVTLKLRRQGNHCLLSVANPGVPISREDLKNIFRRFYRLDKARAMDQSYGLGLSIAEAIVLQHGGKIWAESEKGINTFFVQLAVL